MEILSIEKLKLLEKEKLITYGHNLRSYIMDRVTYADEEFKIEDLKEVLKFLTDSKEFGLLKRKKNKIDSVRSHLQTFNTLMCFHAEKGGLSAIVGHYKSEKYNLMMEKSSNIDEMYEIFFIAFKDYVKKANRTFKINENQLYEQVEEYIERFFEPSINIEKISNYLHLNKQYLMRKYKEETGRTIQSQIDKKKIFEAKKLISFGVSFTEIAYTVGFSSPSIFSRVFKRYEKISPREFKKSFNR